MADSQHFITQGVQLGQKAVELDHAACKTSDPEMYSSAKRTYVNAIDYFRTALKYEKMPKTRETLTKKIDEYLQRAELMMEWLEDYKKNQAEGGGAPSSRRRRGDEEEARCEEKAVAE